MPAATDPAAADDALAQLSRIVRLTREATALESAGRNADALPLRQQALAAGADLFGRRSSDVLFVMAPLASLLIDLDDFPAAGKVWARVAALREEFSGPTAHETGEAHFLHGLALFRQKRFEDAATAFERSAAAWNVEAPQDDDTAAAWLMLGEADLELGRNAQAEAALQRSLQIREQGATREPKYIVQVLADLACALARQGKSEDAERVRQRALQVAQEPGGPGQDDAERQLAAAGTHPMDSLGALGSLLQAMEVPALEDGMTSLRRIVQAYDRTVVPDSEGVQILRYDLSTAVDEASHAMVSNDGSTVSERITRAAETMHALGRFPDAEELFRRAIDITEGLPSAHPLELATRLNLLGGTLSDMGRFTGAASVLRRSLAIREAHLPPGSPEIASARSALAVTLVNLGQEASATELARRVLQDISGLPDGDGIAIRLEAAGSTLATIGLYGEAEAPLMRAFDMQRQAPARAQARALFPLGQLALDLGRYDEAIARLGDAEDASTPGRQLDADSQVAIQVRASRAEALFRVGRHAEAEVAIRNVIELQESLMGKRHPALISSLLLLRRVASAQGHREEAQQAAGRALDLGESTLPKDHPIVAAALSAMAASADGAQRWQDALLYDVRALGIAEARASAPQLAAALSNMASVQWHLGHGDTAIFLAKRSVDVLQRMRREMLPLALHERRAFVDQYEFIYQRLAGWLMESGRDAEADRVMAMLKAEELVAYTGVRAKRADWADDVPLAAGEQAWALRYDAAARQLHARFDAAEALVVEQDEDDVTPPGKQAVADARARVDLATQAFAALVDEMAAAAQVARVVPDVARPAAHPLPTGVVALRYLVTRETLYIDVETAQGRVTRHAAIDAATLGQQIDALRESLRQPGRDARAAARSLHDSVWQPVADDARRAGATTVLLSLDGALRYVPFAALFDGQQWLAEKYAFALTVDPASDDPDRRPAARWTAATMGVSRSLHGSAALPSVKLELASIARILPGDPPRLDARFTRQSLEQSIRDRRSVIHIASHFTFDPASDEASFLLMGDGSTLSLRQLRESPLSLDGVELLTLSACDTAMGHRSQGNEVEAFGSLAARKGARAVLASLWPVADSSTAELMTRFYGLHERAPMPGKAEALREAQVHMIRGGTEASHCTPQRSGKVDSLVDSPLAAKPLAPECAHSHPYYWAPFVLMGNWR